MRLSELTAYASEKYHIPEQHKWADFPGFSVLVNPDTGKWIALLIRQWDGETGTEIEFCDLKCGRDYPVDFGKAYMTRPVRMHGIKWVGIAFDDTTEPDVVFRLFDRAARPEKAAGYTVVLESLLRVGQRILRAGQDTLGTGQDTPGAAQDGVYTDTALPFAGSTYKPPGQSVPARLRQLRRMFEYEKGSSLRRPHNFYTQALFMQDYEDDCPWSGPFTCYFPSYHDMTTQQLRGYFTWRTRVRKGEYGPIAVSAAYIYIYELLNGIGASSPEDALAKMRDFETGFLDAGMGDDRLRQNLRRWMPEFCVRSGLPAETTRQVTDPETLERDEALCALRSPTEHSDEAVYAALLFFCRKKMEGSPAAADDPVRRAHLFAQAWREASPYSEQGRDLFTLCFGEPVKRTWFPLANAVYYQKTKPEDRDYRLNGCRSFHCRDGVWKTRSFEKLFYNRDLLQGFVRETDAKLRRYLKTGRYLKEKPEFAWAVSFIEKAIEEDRQAQIEAARPKIEINLSELDAIRADAAVTRDSLLTDEERGETAGGPATGAAPAAQSPAEAPVIQAPAGAAAATPATPQITPAAPQIAPAAPPELPLDSVQLQVLRMLLRGEDPAALLRQNHLMASITADFINEALYDEIGDSVLLCEDDHLILVEDYRTDIEELLGGFLNG